MTACSPKTGTDSVSGQVEAAQSGGYELPRSALLGTCPFISENFNFDGLLSMIKTQLETKIEGQEICQAPQRALLEQLSAVNNYYSNIDRSLLSSKSAEIYQSFLMDLQVRLDDLETLGQMNSSEATILISQVSLLEQRIQNLTVESEVSKLDQENRQQTQFRRDMFTQLKNVFVSLNSMDPKCVAGMGGYSQLLPPILSVASLASGYSIFSGQAIAGAALEIGAGITMLLQNRPAKEALRNIVKQQNDKVLACTYYSIQHSACEVNRANNLVSQRKPELQSLVAGVRRSGPQEWQEYLDALTKLDLFSRIFEVIASQGSALSLDVESVKDYFTALKINPKALPAPPGSGASTIDKSRWLDRLRIAGLSVPKTDFTGQPLTIDEQIKRATTSLNNSINTIDLVTATLNDNQSFEALKSNLEAQRVDIVRNATKMADLLRSQALLLPEDRRGSVYMSLNAMEKILAFMSVAAKDQASVDVYLKNLAIAGNDLFMVIAQGSVAQIDKQGILALGGKAQERLTNALKNIENRFIVADIQQNLPYENSFIAFKQDQLLLYQLQNLYNDLKGPSSAFRISDIDVTFGSFEQGFSLEIVEMLQKQIRLPSAGHFCSLFSGFLHRSKDRKVRDILKTCKAKFPTLKIETLSYESTETIDYGNYCSYHDYIRKTRGFQVMDFLKRAQ